MARGHKSRGGRVPYEYCACKGAHAVEDDDELGARDDRGGGVLGRDAADGAAGRVGGKAGEVEEFGADGRGGRGDFDSGGDSRHGWGTVGG